MQPAFFYKIKAYILLKTDLSVSANSDLWKPRILVKFQSTYFGLMKIDEAVIALKSIDLLEGPVIFTDIETSGIIYTINSHIQMCDYIEISFSEGDYCLGTSYIMFKGSTSLNITGNAFQKIFLATSLVNQFYLEEGEVWCTFQYDRDFHEGNKSSLVHNDEHLLQRKYSVLLQANEGNIVYSARFATSHCDWIAGSAFIHSEPEEINQQIVHYVNNSVDIMERPNIICDRICEKGPSTHIQYTNFDD